MKQNKEEDIQKTYDIKTSKISTFTLEVCIFHKSFHIKTLFLISENIPACIITTFLSSDSNFM